MMRADPNVYSATEFLDSWTTEVRAGYTPHAELDVLERLNEYFDTSASPEVEAEVAAEVTRASERLIQEEQLLEASWETPTMNDRISAAFGALGACGIYAAECRGLTIEDGWANVGLATEAAGDWAGAVFFHQQDVFDAVRGMSLLLAFGAARDAVETTEEAHSVAVATLNSLARHGVPATWTGHVDDRIEILPFAWARRRWTPAPPVSTVDAVSTADTHPPSQGRQMNVFSPSPEVLEPYKQIVRAYYSCCGFDATLSYTMRGVWRELGGARGQVGHAGDPHVFVQSGDLTAVIPRDALTNLDPREAAALRERAMRAAGPARKPPWWKRWVSR